MSQRNVERVIGRLATDESFRLRFFEDPDAVLEEMAVEGVELNPCERNAVLTIDRETLSRFADAIDPRIQKCDLGRRS
jgi:hypothetical protein